MIDPFLLREFSRQLKRLVGAEFNGYKFSKFHEKLITETLNFSKVVTDNYHRPYTLEIQNCAWQILHGNSVIFSYLLNADEKEKAQDELESLESDFVTEVHFNTEDLSLLIRFKSDYGIKLIHNAEENWKYSYMITSWDGIFEIRDNALFYLDLHEY